MPGNQPQQTDVIPVNGWIMELDAGEHNLASPHFHKISGLSKKTGTIEIVDGGTNVKLHFSDGVQEHSPITLARTRDGSADDDAFAHFIREVFDGGVKRSGTLVQYRFGKQCAKIRFKGLLFNDYNLTDMDTHGSDKADQSYTCPCDSWEDSYPGV